MWPEKDDVCSKKNGDSAVLSHQLPFLREVLEKVKGLIQSIICRYMLYIIFCSKVFEHKGLCQLLIIYILSDYLFPQ